MQQMMQVIISDLTNPPQAVVSSVAENYLDSTGLDPTEFGRLAVGDEQLVKALRAGRCSPSVLQATWDYINQFPPERLMAIPWRLVLDIDEYLEQTGIAEVELGRLIAGDEHLIASLRQGVLDEDDIEDIKAYMVEHPAQHLLSPRKEQRSLARWNDEEDEPLASLWMRGRTKGYIAQRVGKTVTAIAVRATRLQLPKRGKAGRGFVPGLHLLPPPKVKLAVIESDHIPSRNNARQKMRNCLSCGRKFPSQHAGHRICNGCKSSAKFTFLGALPGRATGLGWDD